MTDQDAKVAVAANLRRLRGERTLSEVARLAQTSAGAIRDIEHGERMPGISLLSRLADVFHVSLEDLLKPPPGNKKRPA